MFMFLQSLRSFAANPVCDDAGVLLESCEAFVMQQGVALGVARRYAPADDSAIQKSRRIYFRPRTGSQSAHLLWPAVAKLQAASVPIA